MAEQEGQEKTEAPTERKRQKSRDEGQVAFSRGTPLCGFACRLYLNPVVYQSPHFRFRNEDDEWLLL